MIDSPKHCDIGRVGYGEYCLLLPELDSSHTDKLFLIGSG